MNLLRSSNSLSWMCLLTCAQGYCNMAALSHFWHGAEVNGQCVVTAVFPDRSQGQWRYSSCFLCFFKVQDHLQFLTHFTQKAMDHSPIFRNWETSGECLVKIKQKRKYCLCINLIFNQTCLSSAHRIMVFVALQEILEICPVSMLWEDNVL